MRPVTGPFAFRPCDSANPLLWNGMVAGFAPCVSGAGRNVADLSPSRFDFQFFGSAAAFSVEQSPIGPAVKFAGNAAIEQQDASWGLPCKILTNDDNDAVILSTMFKFNHSAGAKESTVFWSDNPTILSSLYGYRLYIDNNTDKLVLAIYDAYAAAGPSGKRTVYTSATTLTPGRWYHAVVVYYGWMASDGFYGQSCMMFLDGSIEFPAVSLGFPSTENRGSHLATQHARIGSTLGSVAPDISVALVNIWDKRWVGVWFGAEHALASAMSLIQQLHVDPLAMYRTKRRGSGAKGSRLVTIGGTALRRLNVAVAG